jgi:mannose-6-phosphate isomerase-like protein (cupin superfamily)
MYLTRRSDVEAPLRKSSGETVYELIGSPAALGGTVGHSVAEIVIAPRGSSVRHHHLLSEETYYILSGEGRLVIDDRTTSVRPGDAGLILPGEPHQIFNERDEDLVLLAVSAPPWRSEDSVFE